MSLVTFGRRIIGGVLLLTILYCLTATASEVKCTYGAPLGMPGVDCSSRGLKTVPNYLHTNIQVLDLSKNHIQYLYNDSFVSYTSVKLLYLQDNKMKKIHAGAFYPLSNLGVLDLSSNNLRKFDVYCPSSIYRLYLADMTLDNISVSGITSLQHLSLADAGLESFPQLGLIPTLIELNLTGNVLNTITPSDLAGFCHLKSLFVSSESLFTDKSDATLCECLKLETWTSMHAIHVDSFTCKYEKPNETNLMCDTEFDNLTAKRWELCLTIPYAQPRDNCAVMNEIIRILLPLALFIAIFSPTLPFY